ncbi:FG-GAP-like repeat-containing protein [Streptomyces sp. NPDC048629]|uniref:FG-GAP-like repeat-containing protein n=1 Tax=Streptomyces sp. NPDC048629 TaxID=3154824 RepID=UPI0034423293
MFQHVLTSRRARLAAVAVAAAAVLTSLAPLGASPAAAEEPPLSTVTIPAELQVDPAAGSLWAGGTTGFLRGSYESGFSWVSYADGTAFRWDHQRANNVFGTGTDTIARYYSQADRIVLQDVHGGVEQTVAIPTGQRFDSMLGKTVITYEYKDGDSVGVHALSVANGAVTDRTIIGPSDGATEAVILEALDETRFFVEYVVGGVSRIGLVDASLTVKPTPFTWGDFYGTTKLLGDHFYMAPPQATTARIFDVSDWSKPKYEIPTPTGTPLAVVGEELLLSRFVTGAVTTRQIVARRLTDGAERVLLDKVLPGERVAGTDGRLLFVRVDGATARSVRSVQAAADGTAATAKLYDIPLVRSHTVRIAAAQGVLHTLDAVPYDKSRLRSTELSLGGELTAGPRTDWGVHAYDPVPTGDGRVVNAVPDGDMYVLEKGKPAKIYPKPGVSGPLEVSGRFASYSYYGREQRIMNLDTGQIVFRRDFDHRPTSLDGNLLWVAHATRPGLIEAIDWRTGTTVATKTSGFNCPLTELQVWDQHFYWKCDLAMWGSNKVGVHEMQSAMAWELPEHRSALLGENFVVTERDGVLTLMRLGSYARVELGRPADVRPGRGWTVDRSAGIVAFVDASGDTHVTRVPSTYDPRDFEADPPVSSVVMKDGKGVWTGRVWFSKPVQATRLTLVHTGSGRLVRTITGGPARGFAKVAWDGTNTFGQPGLDGQYSWCVGGNEGDGSPYWDALGCGKLTLSGGQPTAHDFAGPSYRADARDDLLVLTSGGSLDVWFGTGTGRVSGKWAGAGWGTTINAAVPFGDVNGDNYNDVLLRMSNGDLRTYKPHNQALTTALSYTKAGTGFGGMNVLTSPGDLTGDGRADLVARNGDSLYLYAGKAGGTLASGVRFGSGWSPFTHIAGAGDLDGDRIGDLVARKSDGSLYRYSGAGGGRLKAGVKIKSGWGASYTTVVGVGDLDSDAKRDLVVRDRAGLLFRISGDGNGSFGTAVQIGSGWGSFKGLF